MGGFVWGCADRHAFVYRNVGLYVGSGMVALAGVLGSFPYATSHTRFNSDVASVERWFHVVALVFEAMTAIGAQ